MKYDLIMMSFDGATVKDSGHNEKEELYNTLENMGSKWFFYPFAFSVRGNTINEAFGSICNTKTGEAYMNTIFKGKWLKTAVKVFKQASISPDTNGLDPLDYEDYILTEMAE